MTSFDMLALLRAFVQDGRSITLMALIVLDLATGVAAALRMHAFDFKRLGQFYVSDVLPFLICYAAVYLVVGVLGASLPPDIGPLLAQITDWAGAGVAAANLLGSVASNLAELRAPVPAPPPQAVR